MPHRSVSARTYPPCWTRFVQYGTTPLWSACDNDAREIVGLLLLHPGVDVNLPEEVGELMHSFYGSMSESSCFINLEGVTQAAFSPQKTCLFLHVWC